jgi:hypothetical protein
MAAGDDKQLAEDKQKSESKSINAKDKKKMTKEERKKEEEMVGTCALIFFCLNLPSFQF